MDFNLEKEETFARALKPNSIKTETKNWNTLEGYVYVISKRMPVADGDPPLNCVKIGMSNITTRDRFKKGFQRLLSFRTSLISFKVHRVYLFEKSDFDEGKQEAFGLNAYNAEQLLHRMVDDKFKPKQVRIEFSNGQKSEWWHIKDDRMAKLLAFCDTKVQLDTAIPPIFGTGFTKTSGKPIKFPKREAVVGIEVDEDGVPQKKKEYRKTNSKHARNLRVRRTTAAIVAKKQEEKDMKQKSKRELEKTVPFGTDLLVGQKFTDKKMHPDDKGLWRGKKKVVDVFKENRHQILVSYEPDIAQRTKDKAKEDDIDNASGYLTINETLLNFPDLQKKYQDSYEYYAKKNKFEDDVDYTEGFT